MIKSKINVPSGTRYLSELVGKELPEGLPRGIFNKSICDCGATTLALTDRNKTVVCSPRVRLLENKRDWCQREGIDIIVVKKGVRCIEIEEYLARVETPKILVTYDSLPRVARLIEDKEDWRVVVDEFHVLLSDSGFKSEVELRTLECLGGFPYVTYLSATPMLDEFVEQIPQFRNLPYTELVWDKPRKVKVARIQSNRPMDAALDIINRYKRFGKMEHEVNGVRHESRECVIYLNSVVGILNLIKNAGLTEEDVNIIVADNSDNESEVRKLGRKFGIGRIPLKGEPNKLITFCTSTAYCGCDFWSESAASFVVCNGAKQNQMVDIGRELMQIAGRQRNPDNRFRDVLFFIYKTSPWEVSEEELGQRIEKKRRRTEKCISRYEHEEDEEMREILANGVRKAQMIDRFAENYAMWDAENESIVDNYMARLNEMYAYKVQRVFSDGISIIRGLEESGFDSDEEELFDLTYCRTVRAIIRRQSFAESMKEYCDMMENKDGVFSLALPVPGQRDDLLSFYYHELGAATIRALGYKECDLKNAVKLKQAQSEIATKLKKVFVPGLRMATQEIKQVLSGIYQEVGVEKVPVATDLKNYGLDTKPCKVKTEDGSTKNGWLIRG